MGKSDPYRGESEGKKVARSFAYRSLHKGWDHLPTRLRFRLRRGSFVTLAGRDAGEVTILRDYLKLPGERVWFVDLLDEPLRRVKELWPEANVVQGDVMEELPRIHRKRRLSFAHLDFMGPLSLEMQGHALTAMANAQMGAVVMLTYLRGRDPHMQEFADYLSDGRGRDVHPTIARQWMADASGINKQLTSRGRVGIPGSHVHYNSGRSPMGLIQWMVTPWSKESEAYAKSRCGSTLRELPPGFEVRDLLHVVDGEDNSPTESLAALLNTDPGTIRALRAHASRGTYKGRAEARASRKPSTLARAAEQGA